MIKNIGGLILAATVLLFLSINSFKAKAETNGEAGVGGLSHDEFKKSERLFHGLIKINGETYDCASCHNLDVIDTLNWNPSAYEIALTYADKDSAAFANALLNPSGKKMSQAHANFNIPPSDIALLQLYLKEVKKTGLVAEKPNIGKLITIVSLILLIILVIVDLTYTHKIRYRWINAILLFTALAFVTKILAQDAMALGRSEGYAPLQPIKFSHKVHAGVNNTDCQYCHHTAEESKSAGIPSVNVCMNCHIIVREGTYSGKFEIKKVVEASDSSKPIEWIRIHRLPDHVFFSHAQHVGAGKLDCAECHGPVDEMDKVTQVKDLSMGWCLDCHRTKKVQFMENEYYTTFEEYHEKITNGLMDSVTVEQIGGTECMKCHY